MNTNPTAGQPQTFQQWINIGIKNNWCSEAVCYNHDELPMTTKEHDTPGDEWNDDCMMIARIYDPRMP
jgi:hypothetical protein